MEPLGYHILVDYYECSDTILSNPVLVEKCMIEAAKIASATVIEAHFHHFSPLGVSGVVIIQESHLTIHTWPELRYAAVDIFTCGPQMKPEKALEYLKKMLEAHRLEKREIMRGRQEGFTERR